MPRCTILRRMMLGSFLLIQLCMLVALADKAGGVNRWSALAKRSHRHTATRILSQQPNRHCQLRSRLLNLYGTF